ncbi:uncharacterized protein [Panulirus ornatus]|uniref:uncharacterized protein n=1 Tax=Panulirus ornatus TaxID=150431 RepID=UPI003A877316
MKIWEPSSCYCCSLQTGSLVVGSVALVYAICNLILGCVGIYALVIQWLAKLKLMSCLRDVTSDLCFEQVQNYVVGFSIALVFIEAVQALMCILLIYGIHKGRPRFMVPYMVWTLIRLSIFLVCSVSSIIVYFNMPEIIVMLLVFWIILAVVESLYLLVSRAQYFKMKEDLSESHVMLEEEPVDL